jgi:hypothetical protein
MSTLATIARALAGYSRWLADPSPAPAPGPAPQIHPDGFMTVLITWALPLGVALIGILCFRHAKKGDMNATLTSFSITVIGVVMVAGAGVWFIFGQYLVHLIVN